MPRNDPAPLPSTPSGPVARVLRSALSRAVATQADSARGYVEKLRAQHPGQTPAQVQELLDKRFLTAVTATGTAVGASAAVPGIGTMTALGAAGADSVLFLEVAALYTMASAAVHGVDPGDQAHRETLVMTVLLGSAGTTLLAGAVGSAPGAKGSLAGGALHLPNVKGLNERLFSSFVRRYVTKRAPLLLGKLAPAGIGAVIGGMGNRKLGRTMVETTHATFGAAPAAWPAP